LRNIWDEVTQECRKLQEKLHNLSSSQNIIRKIKSRRIRWAGHVVRMAERKVYKVLVGKLGGKIPFGRPRRRWDQMNLGEIGCGSVEWMQLAQDRGQWGFL
jgi:hypothetical protein